MAAAISDCPQCLTFDRLRVSLMLGLVGLAREVVLPHIQPEQAAGLEYTMTRQPQHLRKVIHKDGNS